MPSVLKGSNILILSRKQLPLYELPEIISVTYDPHLRPLVPAVTLTMLILLLKLLD